MNPVQWALAMAIVSGVAIRAGWLHAIASAVLIIVVTAVGRVIRNGPHLRDVNGSALAKRRDHRIAEWVITSWAAAFGSEAARDVALEASASLDELVASGEPSSKVLVHALRFVVTLPRQLSKRSDVPGAPHVTIGPEDALDDWDDIVVWPDPPVTREDAVAAARELLRGVETHGDFRHVGADLEEVWESLESPAWRWWRGLRKLKRSPR